MKKFGVGNLGGKSADAGGSPMPKKNKVATVMREFRSGKLKSSSGQKVTNPKQAIAIGLSEAGMSKPKKGSEMKYSKGGMSASKMGKVKTAAPSKDGVAVKGKTKGKIVKMNVGGAAKAGAGMGGIGRMVGGKSKEESVQKPKPVGMRKGGKC